MSRASLNNWTKFEGLASACVDILLRLLPYGSIESMVRLVAELEDDPSAR
jgi:hypothetical protein